MSIVIDLAPKSKKELVEVINDMASRIEEKDAHIEQLEGKLKWLMERLHLSQARQYGKSSEKNHTLSANDPELVQ